MPPDLRITRPVEGSMLAPGASVTVDWTPLTGATQYVFEFSGPDRVFAVPNATIPSDTGTAGRILVGATNLALTVPVQIAPGRYQVRVAGVSSANELLGGFSDPVTLVVGP